MKKPPVSPAPVTTDGVKGIVKSTGAKLPDTMEQLEADMEAGKYGEGVTIQEYIRYNKDKKALEKKLEAGKLKAGVTPEEKQQKFQDTQQANLEMKNGNQQAVVVNAPVTNNLVGGGGGGTTYITPQKASHDTIWEKTLYK